MLRFVNAIGGFSGKVVVIGCEPGEVDDVGLGPHAAGRGRGRARARRSWPRPLDELRTDAAYPA